jgi:hypothetical protein
LYRGETGNRYPPSFFGSLEGDLFVFRAFLFKYFSKRLLLNVSSMMKGLVDQSSTMSGVVLGGQSVGVVTYLVGVGILTIF